MQALQIGNHLKCPFYLLTTNNILYCLAKTSQKSHEVAQEERPAQIDSKYQQPNDFNKAITNRINNQWIKLTVIMSVIFMSISV